MFKFKKTRIAYTDTSKQFFYHKHRVFFILRYGDNGIQYYETNKTNTERKFKSSTMSYETFERMLKEGHYSYEKE